MLILLVVLLASLASFAITRFFVNIMKQNSSKPGHNNVLDVFQKSPYIYLITGILFLILFKLMFRALTFILLGY